MTTAVVVLLTVLALGGCSRRAHPYAFRSPLVSAVSAEDLARRARVSTPRAAAPHSPPPAPVRAPSAHEVAERRAALPAPHRAPAPVEPATAIAARPTPPAPASPDAVVAERAAPSEILRALVGLRDDRSGVTFAVDAMRRVGLAVDDALSRASEREELLALAEQRAAVADDGPPLLGDLVVLTDVVGIVVGADARQTVEFVYLAGGVVRRGFYNRRFPGAPRDDQHRVLNTFVYHRDRHPPREPQFLAGERFEKVLRADRLTAR